MNTVTNEQAQAKADSELIEFLKQGERGPECVRLYTRLTKFKKLLRDKVQAVSEKVGVPPGFTTFLWSSLQGDPDSDDAKYGVYDSFNFYRTLSDRTKITGAASIMPKEWEVATWTTPEKPATWLKSKGIPDRTPFSFDKPVEEIAQACSKLMEAIAKLK